MKNIIIPVAKVSTCLATLTDEQAGQLLRGLCAYCAGEQEPQTDNTVRAYLTMIKFDIDNIRQRYEEAKNKRLAGIKAWKEKATKFNQVQPSSTEFNQVQPSSTELNQVEPSSTELNLVQPSISKVKDSKVKDSKVKDSKVKDSKVKDSKVSSSSSSLGVQGGKEEDDEEEENKEIDFKNIVNVYNSRIAGANLPPLKEQGITATQKEKITAAGISTFWAAVDECKTNDFLTGGGANGWRASFGWIVDHINEILSGKYYLPKKQKDNGTKGYSGVEITAKSAKDYKGNF